MVSKPGDFDFLTGEWRIANRRLKPDGSWDEFPGEATVHAILAGVGSVEELRIPARGFSGMGLRLLDVKAGRWQDVWVNGASGVPSPAQLGGFVGGVGTFESSDVEDGKPIRMRGVWDQVTPTSCRWWQAISRDGGKTWHQNWVMHWTRA